MEKSFPVKNPRISQIYGVINPERNYTKGYHTGIDIVADGADKGIYNAVPGTVIRARFSPGAKGADPDGWGNYVIVRQKDGYDTVYAHLAQIAVTQGQQVISGDKLGLQGATGNVTGPHLHYEVRSGCWQYKKDIDPADYMGIKNQVGPVESLMVDQFEGDRSWAIAQGISDGSDPDHPALRKEVWAMLRRFTERR